jgi:hypothetical protein
MKIKITLSFERKCVIRLVLLTTVKATPKASIEMGNVSDKQSKFPCYLTRL